jgi:hypothetical protein
MINPLNPDAGDTPAPSDPGDRELAERSARVMWRAFPYFAWRYAERGRAFGRSDAAYLVTLLGQDDRTWRQQVGWLSRVLAPRGMPSILLEYQLESLGRLWSRERHMPGNRFLALAAGLRGARLEVLEDAVFRECESLCRAAGARAPERRGAGLLIAGAVVDHAVGVGTHYRELVEWFCSGAAGDPAWSRACSSALELALSHLSAPEGDAP